MNFRGLENMISNITLVLKGYLGCRSILVWVDDYCSLRPPVSAGGII